MKFRFAGEGGHFSPISMDNLISVCRLKYFPDCERLTFRKCVLSREDESYRITNTNGYIIGYSDTDQFPLPSPARPEKPDMEKIFEEDPILQWLEEKMKNRMEELSRGK